MKIFLAALLMMLFLSKPTFAASPIEITGDRAAPSYWLKPDGDRVILNSARIAQLNSQMRSKDPYSVNLVKFPEQIPAADVQAKLDKSHKDNDYTVEAPVKVRYAVTVKRANIRCLPQPWNGDNYDDFQATALDPAEAVAVLIPSRDEKYFFCQARNYFGWIARDEIAFTDRVTWLSYAEPKDFLVVVDHKKTINVEGHKQLFQMGAVIPLIQTVRDEAPQKGNGFGKRFGASVAIAIPAFPSVGSNKTGSEWVARLPVSLNGRLKEVYVTINDDDTINYGWLPCTQNNFVKQAFKFLGDEYGWGGLNDSVDCSAFVGDVYRSMGIELPRDTDRQESVMPIFAVFNDVGTYTRYDIVKRAPVGALLFKPGHVMMYLGQDKNGTPLMIHAASSHYVNGEKIFVRKVMVSDLTYKNGAGVATIDGLTGIGTIVTGG